jgi:hypothetical protein
VNDDRQNFALRLNDPDCLTRHNPPTRLIDARTEHDEARDAHATSRIHADRNQNMKSNTIATGVLALCVTIAGGSAWAQKRGEASSAQMSGSMLVQVFGEVKSIDTSAHRVAVVDAQGHATWLSVAPGTHELDDLPIGSRVKSTALQSVTLTAVKHAKPQEVIPGDKVFVAQVASADSSSGVVMLKDADNLPIEIHMRDPHQAARLSNGAMVKVVVQGQANASVPAH